MLRSTFRLPVVSHGFRLSDDGKTAYALGHGTANAGKAGRYLAAIDLTDPAKPSLLLEYPEHGGHDMDLSPDGNRAYLAGEGGLLILDVSDVQARRPDPEIRLVKHLTWPAGSSITSHTAKWVQRGAAPTSWRRTRRSRRRATGVRRPSTSTSPTRRSR